MEAPRQKLIKESATVVVTPPPQVMPPRIVSFDASSHRVHQGDEVKLSWKVGRDRGDETPGLRTHFGSEWVVIARKAEYLKHLTDVETDTRHLSWVVPASTGENLWRDGQPHDLKPLAHRP